MTVSISGEVEVVSVPVASLRWR